MPRILLAAALLCLAACAGGEAAPPPHAPVKNPTVISVAKNGGIAVNHKAVPLGKLVATLKGMGVTKNSKFTVEGEAGANPGDIEQVMDILAASGLLPPGAID